MQVKLSPTQVQDNGKVRMGNLSPSFPAPRTAKAETADKGKVRMGNLSPSFPAPRAEKAETAGALDRWYGSLGRQRRTDDIIRLLRGEP